MLKKIKLKYKWVTGRNKVIKRYEKFMRNFPQQPIFLPEEDFEQYTQRVLNPLLFVRRCMRLNDIAIRRLDKEIKFLGIARKVSFLITAFWFAFLIGWYLRGFLI